MKCVHCGHRFCRHVVRADQLILSYCSCVQENLLRRYNEYTGRVAAVRRTDLVLCVIVSLLVVRRIRLMDVMGTGVVGPG